MSAGFSISISAVLDFWLSWVMGQGSFRCIGWAQAAQDSWGEGTGEPALRWRESWGLV